MYQIKKLKDCATIIAGQSPKSMYYNTTGEGIPFFQGKTDFGDLYPTIRVYCSQPTKIAEKDDILLSVRAPVGPTNLAPCTVCIGRGLSAIRPDSSLIMRYLLYYFRFFEAQLSSKGTGTTFKAITQSVVKDIDVPIPPLPEQERIVARIEELFSELEKAVETLQTTKQQLAVYRQAVLKEAFEGGLTNGTQPTLRYLVDFIEKPKYGTSKKCDYETNNTHTAVIRIPNIDAKNGIINPVDMKYANFDETELANLSLLEGDILIIRSNGSISIVGTAAMIRQCDSSSIFAGYLMRLRIKDKTQLLPKYLLHYLGSHTARHYIEQVSKSTSGVNNINAQEVIKMSIPFVEVTEQELIITEIESRLSVCDNIERTVDSSLVQAEAMRQSILKEAFEGRLV